MISRFTGIAWLAAGLLSIIGTSGAFAQAISRQVTLVVPYSAGGGTDTVARLIGNQMSRTLGQPVVIENVVGAGGTRANERVARSEPNGTTVLINHVALLAAPSLFINLRYDTEKDFEAVGLVNNAPMLLVGRKSIPGEKPADFVAWIKSQGAKANFAHGGIGTNSHLCGVMMGNVLGFKPTFVAYRGSNPAITDLLAGQIDLLWDQVTNAIPAGAERHAARHRHHLDDPARRAEGRADHGRARHARDQLHHVARALCRQGHAEGDHRRAQRRAAQGGHRPRSRGQVQAARHGAVSRTRSCRRKRTPACSRPTCRGWRSWSKRQAPGRARRSSAATRYFSISGTIRRGRNRHTSGQTISAASTTQHRYQHDDRCPSAHSAAARPRPRRRSSGIVRKAASPGRRRARRSR